MRYDEADGHHHWHLQRAARYSLVFDDDRDRLAAPAEKVGFCLMDSERMADIGPAEEVYGRDDQANCRAYQPDALSVFQGVSAGWRDVYDKGLAFQWVDVSDTLPGRYRLRADVDPDDVVVEANEDNAPAFAAEPLVVPGYNALPLQAATEHGQAVELTLQAEAWREPGSPELPAASFEIVDEPDHGTLSAVSGDEVTYTPDPGFGGVDSFGYTAVDPSSDFPRNPAVATATVTVGDPPPAPRVSISGAPSSMVAGTSVRLQASVIPNVSGVTWSASAGTIYQDGYYAAPETPPAGGTVTVTAVSRAGASASATIAITAKPVARPKPKPPIADPPDRRGGGSKPTLSRIAAMRMGRQLTATVRPNVAGRVRITAFARGRRLGACAARIAGGRTFTCRLRLARSVPLRAPIRLVAGLRAGRTLVRRTRTAAPIPATRLRASYAAGASPGRALPAGTWPAARGASAAGGPARSLFCGLTPR